MLAEKDAWAPDFMIIGAMKAGTSTLYDQLARQPGIFMTTPKEPAFFADDAIYRKGLDWYRALYAAAPAAALKGEASTHYTKLPTYPETVARMQADLPRAPKLIYVIRNPLDRAMSHYLHERSQGVMGEDVAASFAAHEALTSYGCYAMQLAPFVEAYGRGQIHLTSLEQLKADPDTELAAISVYLGSDTPFVWDHAAKPQNVSAERMRRLPMHGLLVESRLSKVLRRALLPQSLRHKIRVARTMGMERPAFPEAVRATMTTRFLADRAELATLFPDHPALTACYPFADD